MNFDEYYTYLGKLLANFNSLEFILRAFLQELPSARPLNIPRGADIYNLPVGTELSESEITSYDSLNDLVDKFNAYSRQNGTRELDKAMINVRDALAHGRVSSPNINDHMRILKFSKPKNGKTKITFNETMDEKWFKNNIRLVHDTILIVNGCLSSN